MPLSISCFGIFLFFNLEECTHSWKCSIAYFLLANTEHLYCSPMACVGDALHQTICCSQSQSRSFLPFWDFCRLRLPGSLLGKAEETAEASTLMSYPHHQGLFKHISSQFQVIAVWYLSTCNQVQMSFLIQTFQKAVLFQAYLGCIFYSLAMTALCYSTILESFSHIVSWGNRKWITHNQSGALEMCAIADSSCGIFSFDQCEDHMQLLDFSRSCIFMLKHGFDPSKHSCILSSYGSWKQL